MDFQKGLAVVLVEPGRAGGAGHGVPLIADTAGVEAKAVGWGADGRGLFHSQHVGASRRGKEAPVAEQAVGGFVAGADGPAYGAQGIVFRVGQVREAGDVKILALRGGQAGKGGVFAEDLGGAGIIERGLPAHAATDFGDDVPVVARLAWGGQDAALARDRAV